jgi:hypothetical protein
MNSIPIQGQIDAQHRLSAIVPDTVPPGPVTIWLSTAQEDEAGSAWMTGIGQQWIDELSDSRQDIYTLEDGQAVD